MINTELAGKRFSWLRDQSGLTQSQLAKYLQVDQSYISKCEQNERKFSIEILEKASNLFGCSIEYFLNEDYQYTPLPIALRANHIGNEDLESIATINKIALNLRYMEELLEASQNAGTN